VTSEFPWTPTTQFGKDVCWVVPNIDHNNKWTTVSCMVAIVKLQVMDVPLYGYEKIITIETRFFTNSHQY
jgi:hypothetical protein